MDKRVSIHRVIMFAHCVVKICPIRTSTVTAAAATTTGGSRGTSSIRWRIGFGWKIEFTILTIVFTSSNVIECVTIPIVNQPRLSSSSSASYLVQCGTGIIRVTIIISSASLRSRGATSIRWSSRGATSTSGGVLAALAYSAIASIPITLRGAIIHIALTVSVPIRFAELKQSLMLLRKVFVDLGIWRTQEVAFVTSSCYYCAP
mmetsp:Transcript_4685/g.6946  ORF Transcript_4685/g.6946 Transcript_4685/m.6946 type:complete len:204 (-) Transcript_4685:164-775(-)